MNRREFVRGCQTMILASLAGCGDYVGNDPPKRELRVRSFEIQELDEGYELRCEVRLNVRTTEVIRDVELLAYADDGRLACTEEVGTLRRKERTNAAVTVQCDRFPTIVTMEAATSVCEDLLIELVYWVDEDIATDDTPVGWHTTYRECQESLPPERFVNRSASPPSN